MIAIKYKTLEKIRVPELMVKELDGPTKEKFSVLIKTFGLEKFAPKIEVWSSDATNKSLGYLSHGIFRYFGKFPPPIARHLIKKHTKTGDLVIDPMCGSGTTALETILLGRHGVCFDVNPLAVLISQVKTTYIAEHEFEHYSKKLIEKIERSRGKFSSELIGLRNPGHWFLEETTDSLAKIRFAIEDMDAPKILKRAFLLTFLSIVRRVSRATTQQGRLFLDAATAEKDALPFFINRLEKNQKILSTVPHGGDISIKKISLLDKKLLPDIQANLIICHPPYFNAYKYSGVNSLELAWMREDHNSVRKNEVREAFKVGRPEKVEEYLIDMEAALKNIHHLLKRNGTLALMIGDTVIRGQYIPVTKKLLERVEGLFKVTGVALRIPKFTEASWAASQRRKTNDLGINLCDFVVTLKRV